MAFQGIMANRGEINQLLEIEGALLVGTKVTAPISLTPEVYVLPMENVLATKVLSFPSLGLLERTDDMCAGNWSGHECTVRRT